VPPAGKAGAVALRHKILDAMEERLAATLEQHALRQQEAAVELRRVGCALDHLAFWLFVLLPAPRAREMEARQGGARVMVDVVAHGAVEGKALAGQVPGEEARAPAPRLAGNHLECRHAPDVQPLPVSLAHGAVPFRGHARCSSRHPCPARFACIKGRSACIKGDGTTVTC
jgi:hypothetical protein